MRLNKLADVAPPTIGFHVRGGDKLAEDKMLVPHYSLANLDLTSLHDAHIVNAHTALTICIDFVIVMTQAATYHEAGYMTVQNRQTTEVQDLIYKFTETWPDVKVSCLPYYPVLMMTKVPAISGTCRHRARKSPLKAAYNVATGSSVQASPAYVPCW